MKDLKKLFFVLMLFFLVSSPIFAIAVDGLEIPEAVSKPLVTGVRIIKFALGFLALFLVGKIAFAIFKAQPQERGKVLLENLITLIIIAICFLGIWGIPKILGMGTGADGEGAVYYEANGNSNVLEIQNEKENPYIKELKTKLIENDKKIHFLRILTFELEELERENEEIEKEIFQDGRETKGKVLTNDLYIENKKEDSNVLTPLTSPSKLDN